MISFYPKNGIILKSTTPIEVPLACTYKVCNFYVKLKQITKYTCWSMEQCTTLYWFNLEGISLYLLECYLLSSIQNVFRKKQHLQHTCNTFIQGICIRTLNLPPKRTSYFYCTFMFSSYISTCEVLYDFHFHPVGLKVSHYIQTYTF